MNSVSDILTDEVLEGLGRATEHARGLPNAAFTSPAFLALENEKLFPRAWMFAGRASALPNKGDVQPITVADRSLFMTRGADDQIHVFHNVCPHRGARLVTEPVAGAQSLTCPYHAWSYGIDGKLMGRPHFHGPGEHDHGNGGPDNVCLFRVRSAHWHDWVFVNLDGSAPAFEAYVQPVADFLERWDLSQFHFAQHEQFDFECNWKLAIENFMDTYHVFKVHRALDEVYDPAVRSTAGLAGVHLTQLNELVGPSRGLTLDRDGPELPPLAGLDATLEPVQPAASIFPNVTLTLSPGNLGFFMFEPVGHSRCIMHMWFYFVADAAHGPEHELARKKVYAEWMAINHEDEGVCRQMQQGRACDAYDGGRLAPYWDGGTAHFHGQVADAIVGRGDWTGLT